VSRSVLATGLAALDIIVRNDRRWYHAGGSAANLAANLAFLGWRSAFAGLIGSDGAGRRVAKDLHRNRVETTSLTLSRETRTPIVVHTISDRGHQFFFECPSCRRKFPRYQPLPASDVPAIVSRYRRLDVFFLDRANAASVELAESYKRVGALVIFEPSVVGRPDHFAAAMAAADIVKYSHTRESALREHVDPIRDGQIRIETRGRSGASFRIGVGAWNDVPGFSVQVVDSAGAGDWTTAGFLTSLPSLSPEQVSTRDVHAALRFGQALGAVSCTFPGARGLASRSRRRVLGQINKMLSSDLPIEPSSFVKPRSYWNGSGCQTCLAPALT
jgi:fructokinase